MSEAIPEDSAPFAIIGHQVVISRQQLRELRSKGSLHEYVQNEMFLGISNQLLAKHNSDIEVTAIDGEFSKSGRVYRLEVVTFTRRAWIAHTAEWDKLTAERDLYKAEVEKIDFNGFHADTAT